MSHLKQSSGEKERLKILFDLKQFKNSKIRKPKKPKKILKKTMKKKEKKVVEEYYNVILFI